MKRILVIAPLSPPITGQQQASNELVRTLRSRYSVETLDYSKSTFRQGNFSLERTAAILAVVARAWRRSLRADVTYLTVSQSLLGNLRDLLIVAFCRSPAMILHLHGSGIGDLVFDRHRLLRFLNRRVLSKKATRVIVLSNSLRYNYERIVSRDRIVQVPNWVRFAASDDEANIRKHQVGAVTVLYLSNMLPQKGYHELLDAYRLLWPSERSRIRLIFAGAFDASGEEKYFVREIESYAGVHYAGVVTSNDKDELLSSAHVLCLPTYYPYEGQPIAILEAYSHGCIVLTTRQGGIPDIFQDGMNGLRVEAKSPSSIAKRLREILEMPPEERKRIARTNIRYARESFSRESFEHSMLSLFETVLVETTPSSATKSF